MNVTFGRHTLNNVQECFERGGCPSVTLHDFWVFCLWFFHRKPREVVREKPDGQLVWRKEPIGSQ